MRLLRLLASLTVMTALTACVIAPSVDSLPESPSLAPPVAATGVRVVVQELQGAATQVWQASPESPDQRTLLVTVAHSDGYGPRLALSPDGARLAAVWLPAGNDVSDTGASLDIINLATGDRRTVVDGIDLRALPVWQPNGTAVAVRRWDGDVPGLLTVHSDDGTASPPLRWPNAQHLTAVGWDSQGRLLAAAMSGNGFDLVAPSEGMVVAHLSNGSARDFRLSPDGRSLSFLAALGADGAELRSVSLDGDRTDAAIQPLARGVFGAVWPPDRGGMVLSGSRSGQPLRTLANGQVAEFGSVDTVPALHVPVSGGPGGWLAARRLEGSDAAQPRSESLWLYGPGAPHRIDAGGPVEVVGWRAGE